MDQFGPSAEVLLLLAGICALGLVVILLQLAAGRREKRALTRIIENLRADRRI